MLAATQSRSYSGSSKGGYSCENINARIGKLMVELGSLISLKMVSELGQAVGYSVKIYHLNPSLKVFNSFKKSASLGNWGQLHDSCTPFVLKILMLYQGS